MKKSKKTSEDFSLILNASSKKVRADTLLLSRGLSSSRERARDLITNGTVLVDGLPVTKPSLLAVIAVWISRLLGTHG